MEINKGTFVNVGEDTGVVVFLEFENSTPEDHIGVWYGEKDEQGIPLYKIVPIDVVQVVLESKDYH